MNEEDIQQFMNAFEDFMKHADLELTKYAYESPDGGKTVYRREHGSMNRELMGDIYEQKASELDVSVDYYVSEFL
jgi:hypothetical protein